MNRHDLYQQSRTITALMVLAAAVVLSLIFIRIMFIIEKRATEKTRLMGSEWCRLALDF